MGNIRLICAYSVMLGMFVICAGCSKTETKADTPIQSGSAPVAKWEGKLVRRPGNSSEDSKIYLVQGGKKHWVVSPAWLEQRGYKLGDTSLISPEELASIPTGEPFQ